MPRAASVPHPGTHPRQSLIARRPECLSRHPLKRAPRRAVRVCTLLAEVGNEDQRDSSSPVAGSSPAAAQGAAREGIRSSTNIRPSTCAPIPEQERSGALPPPRDGTLQLPVPRASDQRSRSASFCPCHPWARPDDDDLVPDRHRGTDGPGYGGRGVRGARAPAADARGRPARWTWRQHNSSGFSGTGASSWKERTHMSDHGHMDHEGNTPSDNRAPETGRWVGLLRSRFFRIAVTAVVLGAGLLLARKFGIGGSILPGVALAAFMLVGHTLMHGGHGSHGDRGRRGGHGSHDEREGRDSEASDSSRPRHGCH